VFSLLLLEINSYEVKFTSKPHCEILYKILIMLSHFTETLNLKLVLEQKTGTNLPSNVFATHLPLNASVSLLEVTKEVYLYRWLENNRPVTPFSTQQFHVSAFSKTGPQNIGVEVAVFKSGSQPSSLTNATVLIILEGRI
jgi:hypothetical protein